MFVSVWLVAGGPIPEAAINMADCRKHLSEHIEEEMKKAESMLRNIEERIESKCRDRGPRIRI